MEIFGVDAFTQSAVTIKARIKTRPQQQDPVGREYRRRLKKAFDEAGIEIPVSPVSAPAASAGGRVKRRYWNEFHLPRHNSEVTSLFWPRRVH
jgi:hypothetical protein